jgi:hypothetical protein
MNLRETIFKRTDALILFFILYFLVASGGFLLGKMPANPSKQMEIFVPFLLGLPFVIGTGYLNPYIDKKIRQETAKTRSNLKKNYEAGELQKEQQIDFLSFVEKELTLSNIAWSEYLRQEGETPAEFESRLNKNRLKFQYSQEAIHGLLHCEQDENGKKIELMESIVVSAIEETSVYKRNPDFSNKCKHLYAYLKAWLICSIRYQTKKLPADWIKETTLDKQEQIDALRYIKDNLLNHERVKKYINRAESREVIKDYLDELIELIKQTDKTLRLIQ